MINSVHRGHRLFVLAVVLLVVPVGCSQQPTIVRQPLAPAPFLTLARQLAIINSRAVALATLRASGSITLTYRGPKGHRHQFQANGTLLVDQTPALRDPEHETSPDMLLIGTYLGQNAFELGMNRAHYWMVNHQSKQAWVGWSSRAGRDGELSGNMPIEPQRVLQMLAITGLYQTARQRVAMTAASRGSLNRIYVIRLGKNGHTWIRRMLFFNRRRGEITAVILFDRAGRSVAAAGLSYYRPVATRGQRPGANAPRLPFQVDIWYPAARAHLTLKLTHASLTLRVLPRFAFATPQFSGLKVVRVNPAGGVR
ncbi:MAG: hypothetical protein HKL95_00325 [Phycisphaerae bacterium]|nr:hypothetical protein [Phycisphaerae bacterium]